MNEYHAAIAVIISATIIAVTLILTPKIDRFLTLKEKNIKSEAVAECGKISSVKWQDTANNAEVSEPYSVAYQLCLKDKGY